MARRTTEKKSNKWRGKTGASAKKDKTRGSQYGYLSLPNGVSMYKATPGGRSSLDFLPYLVGVNNHADKDTAIGIAEKDSLWWRKPFRIHRGVGGGNDSVVCPASVGRKCYICEYVTQRAKEGASRDELKDLRAKDRMLYCVVPLGEKEYVEEPHLFEISYHNFQKKFSNEINENPDNEGFPDVEDGLTIKIRWEKATVGSGEPFADADRIDFEERAEQYSEKILDKVPCLDDCLTVLPYDELKAKFLEIEEDESAGNAKPKSEEKDPDEDRSEKRKRKSTREEEPEPAKDDDACKACEGTGENSKGGVCKPCGGTGERQKAKDTEPVEDSEPEDEKPKRTRKPAKDDDNKERCPHGGTFGKDADDIEACADCAEWQDCIEEKERK